MKNDCAIVIRAFNEERHLGRLLEGVSQQSVRNVQLILVDSGSTDRTVEIARSHHATIVQIDPQEFTFGRSLNIGIAAAESGLVLIASAHVYPVYPDWIEEMLKPFSDPTVALVYGKQRGVEGSHFSERQIFNHWYGENSINPQDHPFCNNANSAIRRSLWEKHPFDESLPGLEDLAWAKWALENKYRIVYSSHAEIKHVHQETWQGIMKRYLREGMAFKSIYPQERFTFFEFIRAFSKNAFSDFSAAAKERVFFKEWLNIVRFRWQQFYGTYLGYQRSGPLTWQLKQSFYYPNQSGQAQDGTGQRHIAPINYSNNSDKIE